MDNSRLFWTNCYCFFLLFLLYSKIFATMKGEKNSKKKKYEKRFLRFAFLFTESHVQKQKKNCKKKSVEETLKNITLQCEKQSIVIYCNIAANKLLFIRFISFVYVFFISTFSFLIFNRMYNFFLSTSLVHLFYFYFFPIISFLYPNISTKWIETCINP